MNDRIEELRRLTREQVEEIARKKGIAVKPAASKIGLCRQIKDAEVWSARATNKAARIGDIF